MTAGARGIIAALLQDMGEASYVDLRDRTDIRIASDLMEMVAAGEVAVRVLPDGQPRMYFMPQAALPDHTAEAPKGVAIYHGSPDKPYWLDDAEMVEARFGSDDIFMDAALPDEFRWGMVRAFRLRADHPVYKGEISGVYVDHDRWGIISMDEAISKS